MRNGKVDEHLVLLRQVTECVDYFHKREMLVCIPSHQSSDDEAIILLFVSRCEINQVRQPTGKTRLVPGVLRVHGFAAHTSAAVAAAVGAAIDQAAEVSDAVAGVDVNNFAHRNLVSLPFFRTLTATSQHQDVAEASEALTEQ